MGIDWHKATFLDDGTASKIDYGGGYMNVKESESGSCPVVSDSLRPIGLYSPWNSPGQNTGVGSLPLLQGILPTGEGIEPRSPSSQRDSLLAEPQQKPKNTGVGSLAVLQRIFLTQESNQSLLHCRWILYQLSYQGMYYLSKLKDMYS